jgi:hypothetical protein
MPLAAAHTELAAARIGKGARTNLKSVTNGYRELHKKRLVFLSI